MKSALSILIGVVLFTFAGCASLTPPSSLTGNGRTAFYANEIGIAFGTAQHAAIELNKAGILSEANTGIVVDATTDVLKVLKDTPDGWRAAAITGIDRINMRLDAAGKVQLDPYIHGVETVLKELK